MKIRRRIYPTGRTKWVVDLGMIAGRRVQVACDSREAALGRLADVKAKRRAEGDAGLSLRATDRVQFVEAREQLAAVGATIGEAVTFFLAHRRPARDPVRLGDLLVQCEREKERLGKSTRYLQQLRCSCLSFIRGRDRQFAHEVTTDEVRAWLTGNAWSPKTQRVYLGDLRTLFAFALESGIIRDNPCASDGPTRIALPSLAEVPIETLTAEQAGRLLATAVRAPGPDGEDFRPLLAYVALGLFCGIRPAELTRLDRSVISLAEGHVVIAASQAKTRRRRVVDLSPNCLQWLALDPIPAGPVVPVNFRRRWGRLRLAAGWRPELQALKATDPKPAPSMPEWPHDVMRHTFASMHYAAHQNESLLKAQLGHSAREEVLFRHYRALKTRAEAAAFWALVPET